MALQPISPVVPQPHPPTVNTYQEGGSHYKGMTIQPWDFIIANNLGYCEGAIIKYVCRYKNKNGVEDLKKAKHFLEKLISVQEQK